MKHLKKLFQLLVGAGALILVGCLAAGRLSLKRAKEYWAGHRKCKKTIIWVSASLVCLFIALEVYDEYDRRYGRYEYDDCDMSQNIIEHHFMDDRVRLYDIKNKCYTTPKINWVSDVSIDDSLAVYALPNKRGFVNINNGQIVIEAQYSKAWCFSEGLAAVVKENKVGFIDKENNIVIPFQFPLGPNYFEMDFVFRNGLCKIVNEEGKYGLIDKTGKVVLPTIYDDIEENLYNKYRKVQLDEKRGLVDENGKVIYAAEYSSILVSDNGNFALVKDGRMWEEDSSGRIVKPFMYDYAHLLTYPVAYKNEEEITYALSDYMEYHIDGYCGILNGKTGEVYTPAIYSSISMLSEEIFEVSDSFINKTYLVDKYGKIICGK